MPYFFECETCGEQISVAGGESVDRECWDCGLPGCIRCMPQPEPVCEDCEQARDEER